MGFDIAEANFVNLTKSFAEVDHAHGFSRLWARGIEGEGITIAVVDTGIKPNYLGAFVTERRDFTGEDDPTDYSADSHGSTIAKLALLAAPKAKVAAFKVFPAHGSPTRRYVIEAIRHCIREFPTYRVLNLSLSFRPRTRFLPCPDRCALCCAVNEAVQAGIQVVAAAGNRGLSGITCPGTAGKAYTIAATWSEEHELWWTGLTRWQRWKLTQSGILARSVGTSFSAAYTSGGIALILSAIGTVSCDEMRRCFGQCGKRAASDTAADAGAGEVHWEDLLACLVGSELDVRFPSRLKHQMSFWQAVEYLRAIAQKPHLFGADNATYTEALDHVVRVHRRIAPLGILSRGDVEQILRWLPMGLFREQRRQLRDVIAML